ncbi:BadF/BadG/BcrA/BcrD ATPase family protein [Bosea sp. LC85]|uniref:BadF/BadG/BcrA/BcrD ATPase family protein n=1 Tax=Bosea sp. LC85 TaxID=1502851 RepID=UPI0004E30FE0|nr:BadF/BadG/BcrA/BcrD ATPase family protein [Bosea sp. LC85]KFC70515.1 BadF/BadG/BcrA/BcrD ATPase family protein [Bosea sp. LC85]
MPGFEPPLGLGIETGGTASRWCLVSAAGEVMARGDVAPMTGHVFSEADHERVRSIFADLAAQLADHGRPSAIVAGVTGIGSASQTTALFTRMLADVFQCVEKSVLVVDDMWLGYRARFAPGEGIVIYAGTGSIGYHLTAGGEIMRAGGYGVLVDDGGAATWIATEALRFVLRREDEVPGSGWSTLIGRALSEAVGGSSWDAARVSIYGGDRGSLGLLARAVGAADEAGDPEAQRIFARAGQELARLALALRGRVGLKPVALAGRAITLSPAIAESFAAAVAPPVRLADASPDVPAVAARLAVEFAANPGRGEPGTGR